MFEQLSRSICYALVLGLGALPLSAQDADTFDPYEAYKKAQDQGAFEAPASEPPIELPPISETASERLSETVIEPEPAAAEPSVTVDTPPLSPNSTQSTIILPFYLSASEYLASRENSGGPAVELVYEISSQDSAPATHTLILARDYVAESRSHDDGAKSMVIYDFKHNRVLTILDGQEPDSGQDFANAPLFAKAHNDIQSVLKQTNNGRKDTLTLPEGNILDAFWLESAAGWSMAERTDAITTLKDTDGVTVSYKNEPALTLSLSDMPYADPALSDSFLLYVNHTQPVHPTLTKQFYLAPAPPQTLQIRSVTPQNPAGSVQNWSLVSQNAYEGDFPLSPESSSILERPDVDPLAYIIRQAADNEAFGGAPDKARMADTLQSLINDGALTEGWLEAQRYQSYWGACEEVDAAICEPLRELENRPDLDAELSELITAFADSEQPETRVKAVRALLPWLEDTDTPAIVLRTLAMTRAKIPGATARAALIDTIEVEAVLLEALAKDPYDPGIYLGLAQYYAANGKLPIAWDIYDALRVAIPAAKDQDFAINGVEQRIRTQAPGFFLPEL